MQREYTARRIEVKGIVQGVGFRPFIYQLANRHNLKGEVLNTSSGVSIHIEGIDKDVESFCLELKKKWSAARPYYERFGLSRKRKKP